MQYLAVEVLKPTCEINSNKKFKRNYSYYLIYMIVARDKRTFDFQFTWKRPTVWTYCYALCMCVKSEFSFWNYTDRIERFCRQRYLVEAQTAQNCFFFLTTINSKIIENIFFIKMAPRSRHTYDNFNKFKRECRKRVRLIVNYKGDDPLDPWYCCQYWSILIWFSLILTY